jgi:hypothetical protein
LAANRPRAKFLIMTGPSLKDDYRVLYRRAFAEFGALALWNSAPVSDPKPEDALVVARALRFEGNMDARRLAERLEAAARAAH